MRSGQPLVGLNKRRCYEDEKLFAAMVRQGIKDAVPVIIDARTKGSATWTTARRVPSTMLTTVIPRLSDLTLQHLRRQRKRVASAAMSPWSATARPGCSLRGWSRPTRCANTWIGC